MFSDVTVPQGRLFRFCGTLSIGGNTYDIRRGLRRLKKGILWSSLIDGFVAAVGLRA
jgi:hypothetical protein